MHDENISIRVENLTRIFFSKGHKKNQIIANDNLSFDVLRGEIFGLLGPNGAGKTTLISQIMGLVIPTTGQITLESFDVIREPDKVKKLVGFLPQTPTAMRLVEVENALYYTGRLRGQPESDARQQVRQLIDELGMQSYARQYTHKLSGGMLRLANFAMALMGRPRVLILDEPTNELDPHNRRLIWDFLAQLNKEQKTTCILVTHNVLEAERVIHRVAVMRQGHIAAIGTPGELKQRAQGQVRLEFHTRDGSGLDDQIFRHLQTMGKMEQPRPEYYRLYLPQERVVLATEFVTNTLGFSQIDDFRLAPPSLEDIYLNL
jgi:ABC-2 type transport system permease protein